MKYLKYRNQFLNEGFSAKSLSKTIGWLSKSGLKPAPFLDDLKEFCEKYKIQLSNIEDNFFKVNVRRSEALKLRSDEVNNPMGLWCLKFWFSATEGYKGYTVTPSKEKEKEAIKLKKSGSNDPFNEDDIKKLLRSDNSFMKTGELKPVVNYDELKTGDIIAFIDGNLNTLWGKIFCSHYRDGSYIGKYVINSNLTGNSPDAWYDENGNDLGRRFGNTDIFEDFLYDDDFGSWHIYGTSPGNDHRKLHIYKESDEPLHVVGDKKEDDTSSFNLSISLYYNDLYQIDDNNSGDKLSITKGNLDNSDFAIIFYLDEFLPHQEEDLSDVRKRRSESKEGATALMDDEEIKRINVKNRVDELVKRFNLSQDINNMTNLKLIFLNILRDDWSLFTLFNGYNNAIFYRIYDFFEIVDNQERYTDEYFKIRLDSRLEEVKNEYRSLLNSKLVKSKSFKEVYDKLIGSNNELLVDFLKNFMRLSIKLKDKIRSKELSSLYDAQILMDRISMISDPKNDSFRLPYDIREGLDYFSNEENATYYLNRLNNDEKVRLDRAMDFMERQIDQL